MKSLALILFFLISTLFFIQSCDEKIVHEKSSTITHINDLPQDFKPVKKWIDPDSLIVRIPGKNGVKLPEIVISEVPDNVEYLGVDKIIPGVSMLHQTLIEKLAGEPEVKSKYPVIIPLKKTQKEKVPPKDKEPITTNLQPILYLKADSLAYYKKIAIRKGLLSIQNNDTVFPPISILTENPLRINALPFSYKENAFFDISVLDANQELPNPYIKSIAMDKNDVMWFESHTGGLISYDGQFFEQYNDPRILTKQPSLSMIIDSKGNIWYGTRGGGVFCYDGIYTTQYKTEQGLASNTILAIIEDKNGNLWFASTNGIMKFDGKSITSYTKDHGLGEKYIFSIFEDNEGYIWAGTFGGGVTKFDGNKFITYDTIDGLCDNIVLSITQDNNGNYWFGTNGGGVSKFNGKDFINYSEDQGLGNNVILSITEDDDENMWFGTYGNGVTYFDGEAFVNITTEEGLSYNYIRTIVEDNKGNLWIGTDGSGVSKININSFKQYTKSQGLIDNNITSIYQDHQDRLCFAPFDGGVMVFEKLNKPGQLESFKLISTEIGLSNEIVLSISQDMEHNYWFGTYQNGVSKLDANGFSTGNLKFTNYNDESGLLSNVVRIVFHDKEGNIWFGTEGGVTKFDGTYFNTLTKKHGLGDDIVLSLFQDKDDAIWIGTMDGGVSCLLNDTLVHYTTNQGLADNTIWTITQDQNGIMWFGTNSGISGFNGSTFRTINTKNGLCNDQLFSMIVDNKNHLWVGTIKGLSQVILPDSTFFDIDANASSNPEILNYGRMDGLVGLDFSYNSVFLDNMNCLWWGTDKALTMLDLTTFRAADMAPIPHVNGVFVNNKFVNFYELNTKDNSIKGIRVDSVSPFLHIPVDLSLPYNLNHLTFNFSATDWSSPNQIQYQYKIEGLDNDWSLSTKENSADYRNIPPGHYSFMVRAKGKSSLWSSEFEIPFTIRWPLYLKWWAILLYVISFLFLIWTIIKWRVSIIEKQKAILEEMVGNRTKELDKALILAKQAAEAKSQFVATISHEIRTPLNAIMGLTHLAVNSTVDPKQEDYLQKIDRSADTLLTLINEILDFSKIEAGKLKLENVNFDLELVINSVIVLNSQLAREKNLEFVINVSPDIPRMLIGDSLRISQVITNLCNNAIKFTNTGEVVISLEVEEEISKEELYIQVSVRDTGIGISDDQVPFLFDKFNQADSSITRKYGGTGLGLSISKLLIEMMGGQIWMDSNIGEGTKFAFDFKVGVQKDQPVLEKEIPNELREFDILVCDDNQSALNSLLTILNSYSLNIQTATSGEEVINILKNKPFDLLLIDLNLQGMSGLDTILSLRSNKEILPIKTILITDSLSSKTSFEHNITGVDGYITKPIISSVLIQKILSVFGMDSYTVKAKDKNKSRLDELSNALAGKHILLAEDNELNRQVIYELVNKIGIEVDMVENGVEVLKNVLERKYDLILMDLHMPVLDGFNASAQIRDRGIQIPIIAVTADALGSVKDKCTEVGIVDIITKPINPELLYDKLLIWMLPETNTEDLSNSKHDIKNIGFSHIAIPNLNTNDGIARFGGDKDLYTKMLKKFISSNINICDDILSLINAGDFENAHIKAHSLKGESGNIGAFEVSELSAKVEEYVLNKNVSGIKTEIVVLKKSIEDISIALHKYFDGLCPDSVVGSSSIKEIVSELIVCLELKNPKVFDLLDDLSVIGIKKSEFKAIEKEITAENHEESISLLRELLLAYN